MSNFVIYTTQRTGSTLLVQLLDSHPQVLCIGEAFIDSEIYHAEYSYYRYIKESIWRRAYSRLFRSRAVKYYLNRFYSLPQQQAVGFKMMASYTPQFDCVLRYIRENDVKIIHLVRQNYLKKYLSLARASQSGQWHARKPVQPRKIHVEPNNLVQGIRRLKEEDTLLNTYLDGMPALKITYQSLQQRQDAAVGRILDFLQVDQDIELTADLVKINPDSAKDVIANYEEVADSLRGTEYERFLYK